MDEKKTAGLLLDRRTLVVGAAGIGMTAIFGNALFGCAATGPSDDAGSLAMNGAATDVAPEDGLAPVAATAEERELAEGLTCVRFEGDDRLDAFLA